MGYKEVIEALGSDDRMQCCPVHDDRTASLSVKEGDDGKALVYCHAGCATTDIVAALGLDMSDLFTLSDKRPVADCYTYTDESGEPLIRVLRTEPKGFTQQRWTSDGWIFGVPRDIRRTLYNLPAILAAPKGTTVYVVEGEKDAETLRNSGYLGTTSIGGANKWRDEYNDSLRGLDIVLVGDNDIPGRESIEKIGQSLTAAGIEYKVAFPKAGMKDVTDIFRTGPYGERIVWCAGLDFIEPDTEIFEPFDWENYETEDIEWLLKPYVPKGSRVLAFGSAGSLKSLWAIWLAARLTNDGKRVAYFSLEMTQSDLVRRLRQSKPTSERLQVFTRLSLNNAQHVTYMIRALKECDLVIIDSWTAAHKGADNDEVARLDNEVFKPLIATTGATILILDNTGHPSVDSMGKKVATGYARGASAKGDKMEVCYEKNSRILMADLRWQPAHKLSMGDQVIGFDENSPGFNLARKFHTATVTRSRLEKRECMTVTTSSGDIVVTPEHRFLVRLARNRQKIVWKQAGELVEDDGILSVGTPWVSENSREAGYLAGQLDGEGCLVFGSRDTSSNARVTWAQRADSPDVDYMESLLISRGFGVSRQIQFTGHGTEMAYLHILGGWIEQARLLGIVEPRRFLRNTRLPELWEGHAVQGLSEMRVLGLEKAGSQEVCIIETSTGTLIGEGALSHNCLWFDRPDEGDNYRTKLTVKKMRLDHPIPAPVIIETPRDRVEFYRVKANEPMYTTPLWPYDLLDEEPEPTATETSSSDQEPNQYALTSSERRALARLNDTFRKLDTVSTLSGVEPSGIGTGA